LAARLIWANLFDTEISYDAIMSAIQSGRGPAFGGTVEFFPQEGKYHVDGHRKCGIAWQPDETVAHDGLCSVCGKRVTVGVLHRVAQLADRSDPADAGTRPPFLSVIPLKEILSEILNVGPQSKAVARAYRTVVQKAGSEFYVLIHLPVDAVRQAGGEILAEAIRRMRAGDVVIRDGYDGEFGQIRVFSDDERPGRAAQDTLFGPPIVRRKPMAHPKTTDVIIRRTQKKSNNVGSTSTQVKIAVSETLDTFPDALNPSQRRAVEHVAGPALVASGPGTGKTRVLTCRIASLIRNQHVPPESILAVTFTNKAADTMRQRLGGLLGDQARSVTVSTFHSFGHAVLKAHADVVGRTPDFHIVGDREKEQILKTVLDCPARDAAKAVRSISDAKQAPSDAVPEELSCTFEAYEQFLREQNLFDLDDLIVKPVRIFEERQDILSDYIKRYLWMLIDEYQDVNATQYRLVRALMPGRDANLFCIGDPDQAIYGFRGADVRYIRRFRDDYPDAAVFTLEMSYRCSERILTASAEVVRNIDAQTALPSGTTGILEGLEPGVKIRISRHTSDKSEAEFVARTIERLMGGLRFFSMDSAITQGEEDTEITSLSDFAVLCRTARQMGLIEKAFHDHTIPFQSVGDLSFFEREPVHTILNLVRLSVRPDNGFLRKECADAELFDPLVLEDIVSTAVQETDLKTRIETITSRLRSSDDAPGQEDIRRLVELSFRFGDDVEDFLKWATLGSGIDLYDPRAEAVSLMTLHAAKGLEFPCVFITGCEDGLIPYGLFKGQKSDVEEEGRLLYVGMTRTKRLLYLSHAEKRFLH